MANHTPDTESTVYTFQFYVRCKDPHPADMTKEGVTLAEAADLFKSSLAAMGETPAMFNCLITWRGVDGESAAIRYDSFMHSRFKICLGHDEEPEVLRVFHDA